MWQNVVKFYSIKDIHAFIFKIPHLPNATEIYFFFRCFYQLFTCFHFKNSLFTQCNSILKFFIYPMQLYFKILYLPNATEIYIFLQILFLYLFTPCLYLYNIFIVFTVLFTLCYCCQYTHVYHLFVFVVLSIFVLMILKFNFTVKHCNDIFYWWPINQYMSQGQGYGV